MLPVLRGGRVIVVTGRNLDVVQQPVIAVWVEPVEVLRVKRRRRRRLALLTARQQLVFNSTMTTVRPPQHGRVKGHLEDLSFYRLVTCLCDLLSVPQGDGALLHPVILPDDLPHPHCDPGAEGQGSLVPTGQRQSRL